ncbi:MAG: hypothetical protein MK171_03335 [Pirellulales bacterium]|nr:hypothetical protein [Pirellulales bacterium]
MQKTVHFLQSNYFLVFVQGHSFFWARRFLAGSLIYCLGAVSCFAGGGPENVFLLVKAKSRDSLTVANHYIDLRKIPLSNVYCMDFSGKAFFATGEVFRQEILLPALAEIKRRGLADQIDYLVYSCGFPWRIDFTKDFPEAKFPPELRPMASLTGATYLAAFVAQKRKEFVGMTNFYAPAENAPATVSQGFRAQYKWSPGGKRTDGHGLRYYLSAMLGVTNGRGNSVDEILRYLRRSATADGKKPRGTIHFVKNKGPRSRARDSGFDKAALEIRRAGVNADVRDGKFLKGAAAVMGMTTGWAQLEVQKSGCNYLPGAFCDNFTSAGGNFIKPKVAPGQTCVSEFLREGAAGANGTVVEPFSIAQKFPSAGLHVHYVHGCSMAEAFYQSVYCPYQQILVGDPLCQPWANFPRVAVEGMAGSRIIRDTIEIVPVAKTTVPGGIRSLELYVDGKRVQRANPGKKFMLDTKFLDDGPHELRVVAVDGSSIETQGRWTGRVIVKNGADAIELSVDRRDIVEGMRRLAVKVVSTQADPVALYHQGREVGRVAKGSGVVHISVAKLGSGPVALFAKTDGESPVRSRTMRIDLP